MAGPSWIITCGSGTNNIADNGRDNAIGENKNIYLSGFFGSTTPIQTAMFLKFNRFGVVQWQRQLSVANRTSGIACGLDSEGNAYLGGSITRSNSDCLLIKFNKDGGWHWQKVFGGTGAEGIQTMRVDPNDNVLVVSNGDCLRVFNFAKSGALTWQRAVETTAGAEGLTELEYDDSYVYCGGYSGNNGIYMRLNKSGTTDANERFKNITRTGGAGNIIQFDCLRMYQGSLYGAISNNSLAPALVKFAPDGTTFTWQKTTAVMNTGAFARAITDDGAGHFFVLGNCTIDLLGGTFLIKYDTDGNIIWQKFIYKADGTISVFGLTYDAEDDALLISGSASVNGKANEMVLMRLQADGSDSGTFGQFVVQNLAVSETTTTYVFSNQSFSVGAALTIEDASYTITDGTQTIDRIAVKEAVPSRDGGYQGGG